MFHLLGASLLLEIYVLLLPFLVIFCIVLVLCERYRHVKQVSHAILDNESVLLGASWSTMGKITPKSLQLTQVPK